MAKHLKFEKQLHTICEQHFIAIIEILCPLSIHITPYIIFGI